MQHVSSLNIGRTFLDTAMCASAALTTYQQSMSSRAASRASHTVQPGSVAAQQMTATSGLNTADSFALLGPDGSWLKTYQGYSQMTLDGFSEMFLETWPRSGTMRNGIAYRRAPLVRRMQENEYSLLPTPQARDGKGFYVITARQAERRIADGRQLHLVHVLTLLLGWHDRAWMNPRFTEMVMGFPSGWTDLED
jgi:hypothetical protein